MTYYYFRFGDMSSNADTTSKQLLSVSEELDTTQSAMKVFYLYKQTSYGIGIFELTLHKYNLQKLI